MKHRILALLSIVACLDVRSEVTFSGTNYTLRVSDSGRIAMLEIPTSEWDTWAAQAIGFGDVQQMSQRVYNHFRDEFDFILFISDQDNLYSGLYFRAKNDVQGIGVALFNSTQNFGSSNQLQGVIHLNAKSAFLDGPGLHEFCHRWANYLDDIPDVGAHWGFSSAGGQLGGWQYGTLMNLGGGVYQADGPKRNGTGFGTYFNGAVLYSELELYLMGLTGSNEVTNPIQKALDAAFTNSAPGRFTASSIQTLSITNIINTEGSRIPSYVNSQKSFRTIVVVLTKSPISSSRLASYEADVAEFSFAGNDAVSYRYNFWEATGGRATMKMDALISALKQPLALRITNLVVSQSGQTSFQWLAMGGVRYRVQFSNGNLSGGFQDIVRTPAQEISPASDGGVTNMTFTDDFTLTGGSSPQGWRFFRVRVVSP